MSDKLDIKKGMDLFPNHIEMKFIANLKKQK